MGYIREQVEKAVKSKGYIWFEDLTNKGYDVNIVGIRNSSTGQNVTNVFDDWLTISYKENGVWKFHIWSSTTDPGKKGVMEYHNPAGVARLVEGQYRGSHGIGLHQGKYEALKQKAPVKVYRDFNLKDGIYDESKIESGVFGINIHKAGEDSNLVSDWSHGCTVFKRIKDFNALMTTAKKAKTIQGDSFTYTVIESKDI